jgi:hypothetical protein
MYSKVVIGRSKELKAGEVVVFREVVNQPGMNATLVCAVAIHRKLLELDSNQSYR